MLAVCPGEQDIHKMKEEFRRYFVELNNSSKKQYPIEASTGIYITEAGEIPDFEELVEKSDRLMYEEKNARKNKRDENDNIRPIKGHNQRARIDGMVSLLIAYSVLHNHFSDYKSFI